ncbi:MAG: thioredoxin family protein [Nitrososphaerota archaeon]|nr:thioredoxin family protein [Nitrososphaerota archaeon]
MMHISNWIGKDDLSALLDSNEPRVVLFAADWCGYCSRFIQLIHSHKTDYDGQIHLVNTDDTDESLWDVHKINLVPTLVVFSRGEEIMRREGRIGTGLRQDDLEAALQAALTSRQAVGS